MSSVDPVLSAARVPRPNLNKAPRVKKPAKFHKDKNSDKPSSLSNKSVDSAEASLKNKYRLELNTLLEVFPNWTETDLYYALEEAEGDLEITIARISDGISCQWGEVKSRKEKLHDAKRAAKQSSKPFSSQSGKSFGKGANLSQKKAIQSKPESDVKAASQNTDSDDLHPADVNVITSEAKSKPKVYSSSNTRKPDSAKRGPASSSSQRPPAKPAQAEYTRLSEPFAPSSGVVSWAKIAKRAIEVKSPAVENIKTESKDRTHTDNSVDNFPPPLSESLPGAPEAILGDGSTDQPNNKTEEDSTKPAVDDKSSFNSPDEEHSSTPAASLVSESTDSVVEEPAAANVTNEELEDKASQKSAQPPQKLGTPARIMQQKEAVVMPPGSYSVDQLGLKFGNLSTKQAVADEKPVVTEKISVASAQPSESQKDTQETATGTQSTEITNTTSNATEQPALNAAAASAPFGSTAQTQNALLAYAANQQQIQNQYQQNGMLAMPQGPLPNDFGASMLYGVDANRTNTMGYYNENFGQANTLSSNPQTKEESSSTTQNISSTATSNTNPVSNISSSGLGMGSYPQQFQPNSYQGLTGLPMYSPFYYNIGMMQPGNQYHNPSIGSNYNQPFMKQAMFPMYPNNLQNLNMQQAQYQQLSMLQQQLQMNQNLAQNQTPAQQNIQPSQQQSSTQQNKQTKQPSMSSNSASQHVGLGAQRSVANPSVGQYGGYSLNTHSNNQQQPGNIPFDSEASQAQNVQQYGLSNSQIPGFFNSASKTSPVTESGISSMPNNKDLSGTSTTSSGSLNPNQPAAIIGGTTFYSNPQHPSYSSQQVPSGYPAGYNQSHQQVLSPQQYYGNYGHTQQSSFSQSQPSPSQIQQQQGHSQNQTQTQGQSQAQSLPYSQQGGMSSVYNPKAQYHHSNALHSNSQQTQPQQPQHGSYNPYNQLRSSQGYWAGQN